MTTQEQLPHQATQQADSLPVVSVVIPTKNRVRFLRNTIESVLTQDYPNIECIVADGGSTDGTIELLKSYGERITWFSEQDRGAFDAINTGWRRSRGTILAWLNSDDEWEPGAVTIAAKYFEAHPEVSVVYGTCGAINAEGELLEVYPPRLWDLKEAVEYCDHIIHQAAAFMRRRILEDVDYLYPAWCHDHDLWLRIALAGGKFGRVPDILANARIWPENLGNSPAIIIPGKVGLTQRFFETAGLPESLAKLRRRAMSNAYVRCIYYFSPRKLSNWTTALGLLCKAAYADPSNTPRVAKQAVFMVMQRFPVLFKPLYFLRGALALIPLSLLVVAFGITIALVSGPKSVLAASAIFFFVSTPLLLVLILRRIKVRH